MGRMLLNLFACRAVAWPLEVLESPRRAPQRKGGGTRTATLSPYVLVGDWALIGVSVVRRGPQT